MNIHDIAKRAGVSSTTVSRFLNDGYVSESKRAKIQKVIDETRYAPMLGAQTLRTKRKKLIGVIIPKISSESVSRTVDGISEVLATHEYQILLGNTNNLPEKELEYFSIFQANTDGILFMATILTPEHRKMLQELQVPLIVIGQELDEQPCIYYDDFGAARQLTGHMVTSGCRHFGYIGVTNDDRAAGQARQDGFLAALQEAGITMRSDCMKIGPFRMESGVENMKNLLTVCPELDAVFCATDSIAIGAMQSIRESGRRIPEDVSVAGVGDSQISRIIVPSLTTAHFHYRTSGQHAAEILMKHLDNPPANPPKIKMGFELVVRDSTL